MRHLASRCLDPFMSSRGVSIWYTSSLIKFSCHVQYNNASKQNTTTCAFMDKPANFLILNLLLVPHEEASHGRDEFPTGGVLALKSAPYVTNQGPSGALGVKVGVKLTDLTSTPEPLSGHETAVVRKYGE